MIIKKATIKNFRAIKEQTFSLNNLSILIGNNATGKTSYLEAIHYALSPFYLSSKIEYTDFYQGTDESIIIEIEFESIFIVELADGYTSQNVECNKIHLEIRKRDRSTPLKAFSDGFVVEHYVVPLISKKSEKGWSIKRKSGSDFDFTERDLNISIVKSTSLPRSFFFNKNRDQQLKKGYNSSISTVFDDFNWRFNKGLRKDAAKCEEYLSKKKEFDDSIIDKIDDSVIDKTFKTINEKLKVFKLDEINLSFINCISPFDSAFISKGVGNIDLPVSNLGSGIEMIVSLIFLETLASLSKENVIILIDEPELHLHPKLQEQFLNYLKNLSKTIQVILSTHSPYIYKDCMSDKKIELLITCSVPDESKISNYSVQMKTFPWSPSWGEINFIAYKLSTIEYFNELYGYLQDKNNKYNISDFDNYLVDQGVVKNVTWVKINASGVPTNETVTLITYIRNRIHHPENPHNQIYSEDQLHDSITELIRINRI